METETNFEKGDKIQVVKASKKASEAFGVKEGAKSEVLFVDESNKSLAVKFGKTQWFFNQEGKMLANPGVRIKKIST